MDITFKINRMKKIMFIALVAFLSTTAVNAQTTFGVKAGVNFANLSGDDVEEADSRTSFHLGLIAEIMLSENFAVQPEVLYSGQGAEEGDMTLKLDYITIPVMLKYYVSNGLSIEAGPQVGFNVLAEAEGEDIEDVKTDIGAGLGLGYALNQGIFFQARYNFGFSDIVEDVDAKNGVFQLSLGYRF